MLIVEDQSLLDELVLLFQEVDVGFVLNNVQLILLEVVQLVLQGAVHLNGDPPDLLVKGRPTDRVDTCLEGSHQKGRPPVPLAGLAAHLLLPVDPQMVSQQQPRTVPPVFVGNEFPSVELMGLQIM